MQITHIFLQVNSSVSKLIGYSVGDFKGWAYNESTAPYENEFLMRFWRMIDHEKSIISEEIGSAISFGDISAMISKEINIMFNSRLTPEENDILQRYRSLSPKDRKEIGAIMNLKLSEIYLG